LAQRFRYLGVEPDAASFTIARESLARCGGNAEVRNGSLSSVDSREQFDLVCAFEVLEHIEDDRSALAEWVQRLRPGGWLMLSVPAHQRRFGAADMMAGHFRRYDPGALAERLREAGLIEVVIRHYGMPLGYLLEFGRNLIGRHRNPRDRNLSMADRTSGSGRLLQPGHPALGAAVQLATAPFRRIQRMFPHQGPGLVACARRPLETT
jgi:SAM-dependent methyltransferase